MTSTPTTAPPISVDHNLLAQVPSFLDQQALQNILNLNEDDLASLQSSPSESASEKFPFDDAPLAPEAELELQTQFGSRILDLVQEREDEIDSADAALQWLVKQRVVSGEIYKFNQKLKGAFETGKSKEIQLNQPTNADLSPSFVYDRPEVAFELDQRQMSMTTLKALHAGFVPAGKTKTTGLKNRLVFQIRGVRLTEKGIPEPMIYSHLGLATNQRQAAVEEWSRLKNFTPWQEIYNQDNMVLREGSLQQAQETGHYILVPTIWDVAWLWENGIFNCGATFSNMLNSTQVEQKLKLISQISGVNEYLVMFDRSKYMDRGNHLNQEKAVERIQKSGLQARGFDWLQGFGSGPHKRQIPYEKISPSELDAKYLQWFREKGII